MSLGLDGFWWTYYTKRLIFLDIERETTALYTQHQRFKGPWLLALSLGAKLCDNCEIPSTGLAIFEWRWTLRLEEGRSQAVRESNPRLPLQYSLNHWYLFRKSKYCPQFWLQLGDGVHKECMARDQKKENVIILGGSQAWAMVILGLRLFCYCKLRKIYVLCETFINTRLPPVPLLYWLLSLCPDSYRPTMTLVIPSILVIWWVLFRLSGLSFMTNWMPWWYHTWSNWPCLK